MNRMIAVNDSLPEFKLASPPVNSEAEAEVRLKARLLCTLGWRMAKAGAETRLIVQSMQQMAADLGLHCKDIGFSPAGVTVKVLTGSSCIVEFKEINKFGINMASLTRLHQICLSVTQGKLTDPHAIFHAVRAVRPHAYPAGFLVVIESLASALFSYLNGGDLKVGISALIGGFVLMYAKFFLVKRGYFEIFTFMVSAFCGCATAFLCSKFMLGGSAPEISLSIMATTLLLVPGFPYMNGFLDVFKGYTETGMVRLYYSIVLTAAAAVGLLGALFLTGFNF